MFNCDTCYCENISAYECSNCKKITCKECIIKIFEIYNTHPYCLGASCGIQITYSSIYDIVGPEYFKTRAIPLLVKGFLDTEQEEMSKTSQILAQYQTNLRISRRIHEIAYHLLSSPNRPTASEKKDLESEMEYLKQEQQSIFGSYQTKKIFCPDCNTLVLQNKYDLGKCVKCSKEVCLKCQEFSNQNHMCSLVKLNTLAEISKISKPCPRCNIPIAKVSGCDHMFCVNCQTSFDWKNGKTMKHGSNPHYYELLASGRIQLPEEENCVLLQVPRTIKEEYWIKEHHKLLCYHERNNNRVNDSDLVKLRASTILQKISEEEYYNSRIKLFKKTEYTRESLSILNTLFIILCEILRSGNLSIEHWEEIKTSAKLELYKIGELFGICNFLI